MTTELKLKAGSTYYTRSICDHNCIYTAKILKRSEKMVTFKAEHHDRAKRAKIHTMPDGEEFFLPNGQHSMCPTHRAGRTTPLFPDWHRSNQA